MRDLEPLRAKLHGKLDVTADIVDVLAVDRSIDGERQPEFGNPTSDIELLLRGARIGADPLGVLGVDVLERDLDVVEPALDEVFQPATIKGDGGGDLRAADGSISRRR
jgi:hypothetical protein